MADNEAAEDTLLTLTADIVAAHVSNNSVAVNDLPNLIQNVHGGSQRNFGVIVRARSRSRSRRFRSARRSSPTISSAWKTEKS